jgi:glycosyltransferase involved in cell wall biosynthesis
MKICLLTYRGNPYCGGQGIYTMHLASELVKLGHEVHVILGPPYFPPLNGVHLHYVSNHNFFNVKENFIKPGKPFAAFNPLNLYEFIASKFGIFPEIETFSIRAFLKLKELVKVHKFDIIHDNQSLGYGFLLIKNFGIPFVSTIHHPLSIDRITWFEHPSDFLLKIKRVLYYPLIMQGFVARRMDHILTVSQDSAGEIVKAFGVKREKISVVYNGLDTGWFRPLRGLRRMDNSVIFVGNVEDRKKGVVYLLKALTLMKNRAHLTVVDGGAPNRRYVTKWIDRFGLNDRVHFTGKVSGEKLLELYSMNQVAVSPSLYEGFGFPAAEAMACGLPLVASDAGALPEVTGKNMEAACFVKARDPYELAKAIDFLIDHPEIRKNMGAAARKRVAETFTWRKAAQETVEMYRKVINAYS